MTPGNPLIATVPIYAQAGFLKSSTRDLMTFAEAALGRRVLDNGTPVPSRLRSAFQVAKKSYAYEGSGQRPCHGFPGLAWAITTADGGMGESISKNGGLPGLSTEVRQMPSLDLAPVVLVNSLQNVPMTGKPDADAAHISDNILAAIVRSGVH